MGSFLFRLLMIFTIPAMAIPQDISTPIIQAADLFDLQAKLSAQLLGYDEILYLIDALENESLDSRCTSEQIDELAEFVAMLAQKGTVDNPVRLALLQEDIYSLYLESGAHGPLFSSHLGWIDSFAFNYGYVELCKHRSWFGKRCHSIGKFVKKHKTEIIVGTAIVVAAVVVTVAVVAVAGASAGTSVAAAAGATSIFTSEESVDRSSLHSEILQPKKTQEHQKIENEIPSFSVNQIIPQMVEENANEMKVAFLETLPSALSVDSNQFNEKTLREKAREYGSFIAHQTLDAIDELIEPFPQFFSEIKELGSKISPQSFDGSELLSPLDPLELHKERVSSLHNKIDEVFDTDYAYCFSPEAKALSSENDCTIGILPPLPGNGFFGKKGWELKNPLFQAKQNVAVTIEGRVYRGHAIDQMRNRGIPPSVVENTIRNGELINVNKANGTLEYFDKSNKIKVVINESEEVVTAMIVDR